MTQRTSPSFRRWTSASRQKLSSEHQTVGAVLSENGKVEKRERGVTDLDVAVSLEIKHGKAADVPEPIDMDSELAEKVDDSRRAWWQRKPKDEWRQHDASKLRRESDRFHREKIAKLRVHNLGV